MYARLSNRDVAGADVPADAPAVPVPPLHATSQKQGAGEAREPEPAPSDDEMSPDDDLTVVD